MYFTACALLGLLASVMFFAVHIGPFVVQQPQERDSTSTSAKEVVPDGAASSSSHLAEGPLSGEDYSGAQSTDDSTAIPVWMSSTFVNWRRSYTPSSELPFIWTHEKSGGEVVAETLTKCLSKVVAGDGKNLSLDVKSFDRLMNLVQDMLAGYAMLTDEHLSQMSWLNPVLSSCIHTSNEDIRLAIQKLVERLH